MNQHNQKVTCVGAGIVNLISAYYLLKKGYQVQIIDKCGNPFEGKKWQQQGATFGGENARMYSLTEADNYNEKKHKIYSNMTHVFEKSIHEDGWRVTNQIGEAEKEWISEFKSINPEAARTYAEDIYKINVSAGTIWDDLIASEPSLFEDTNVKHDIVRVYSHKADFLAAREVHKRLGSYLHTVEGSQLGEVLPCHEKAKTDEMLGGVMKVKGFTLQVHDFCKNLISYLTERGATFFWHKELKKIIKNDRGEICGLKVDDEVIHSDHYVLSLGAYAGNTLDGVLCRNRIQGVLGIWLSLPDVYGLPHSFKIHKNGHVGEDTNVTLVRDHGHQRLVFGSGYGYVGKIKRMK